MVQENFAVIFATVFPPCICQRYPTIPVIFLIIKKLTRCANKIIDEFTANFNKLLKYKEAIKAQCLIGKQTASACF